MKEGTRYILFVVLAICWVSSPNLFNVSAEVPEADAIESLSVIDQIIKQHWIRYVESQPSDLKRSSRERLPASNSTSLHSCGHEQVAHSHYSSSNSKLEIELQEKKRREQRGEPNIGM